MPVAQLLCRCRRCMVWCHMQEKQPRPVSPFAATWSWTFWVVIWTDLRRAFEDDDSLNSRGCCVDTDNAGGLLARVTP
eukprot:5528496-Amphidinium_carterae.1